MQRSTWRALRPAATLLLSLGLVVVLAGAAWAQGAPESGDKAAAGDQKGDEAGEKKDDAPKVKVERGAGGKKVYRITTGFVIEGRIQKPNAFYVLERSQINYDWAALKKDFLPRILESVKKHPF